MLVLFHLSFRWPLENARLTSTFGESRGDHYHDGIDLVCADDKIYPLESGKLLYYWEKSIFPTENSPGGGNYMIIKHDRDIYSIYMHLLDGISEKQSYNKGDVIGMVGNSGHSFSKHLHFSVLDSTKRESLNPLGLLPGYEDKRGPEINDMYLRIGEKYIMIRNNADIRLTKHYPLLIKIIDTVSGREKLGVYRLRARFNNNIIEDVIFNKIQYSKDGLAVNSKSFDQLFDEKGLYKLSGLRYNEGVNSLEITAVDFAGNKSEKVFTFNVKLDME